MSIEESKEKKNESVYDSVPVENPRSNSITESGTDEEIAAVFATLPEIEIIAFGKRLKSAEDVIYLRHPVSKKPIAIRLYDIERRDQLFRTATDQDGYKKKPADEKNPEPKEQRQATIYEDINEYYDTLKRDAVPPPPQSTEGTMSRRINRMDSDEFLDKVGERPTVAPPPPPPHPSATLHSMAATCTPPVSPKFRPGTYKAYLTDRMSNQRWFAQHITKRRCVVGGICALLLLIIVVVAIVLAVVLSGQASTEADTNTTTPMSTSTPSLLTTTNAKPTGIMVTPLHELVELTLPMPSASTSACCNGASFFSLSYDNTATNFPLVISQLDIDAVWLQYLPQNISPNDRPMITINESLLDLVPIASLDLRKSACKVYSLNQEETPTSDQLTFQCAAVKKGDSVITLVDHSPVFNRTTPDRSPCGVYQSSYFCQSYCNNEVSADCSTKNYDFVTATDSPTTIKLNCTSTNDDCVALAFHVDSSSQITVLQRETNSLVYSLMITDKGVDRTSTVVLEKPTFASIATDSYVLSKWQQRWVVVNTESYATRVQLFAEDGSSIGTWKRAAPFRNTLKDTAIDQNRFYQLWMPGPKTLNRTYALYGYEINLST